LAENTAAILTYALGWLTGLIFYFIDKRPYVRFHGCNPSWFLEDSISSGTRSLCSLSGLGPAGTGVFIRFRVIPFIDVVAFTLWIFLMVKANQGQRFRIPVAADLAETLFGKA
jgi:uncharacterized membrane protein